MKKIESFVVEYADECWNFGSIAFLGTFLVIAVTTLATDSTTVETLHILGALLVGWLILGSAIMLILGVDARRECKERNRHRKTA